MSKLAQYWPTIRQVIYGILAAGLAVAAAAGWITSEQSDQWLAHAVTALGALGFIVAGLYVPKAPDSAPKTEPVVYTPASSMGTRPEFGPVIPWRDTAESVAAQAQATVDQARAELERRLGR